MRPAHPRPAKCNKRLGHPYILEEHLIIPCQAIVVHQMLATGPTNAFLKLTEEMIRNDEGVDWSRDSFLYSLLYTKSISGSGQMRAHCERDSSVKTLDSTYAGSSQNQYFDGTMNRICLLLAATLSWAYATEYEIIGVKVLNPLADRLSDDEIEAYNEFMSQNELRQRSLRYSRVYNCCELCYYWSSPQCGIYLTNGYCSADRMTKCRAEAKADAEFDPFGYRNLGEESITEVTEISSGLSCEMAKKKAMEELVNALNGRESTKSSLQSILDGVVLTCYAIPKEKELISSFSLWDATTNTLVSDNIGDTIQLCSGFRFNVEAVVSNREKVDNVKFELHGSSGPIYDRVEYQWRYMLYGDHHNEIIFGDALMDKGRYMLRATPNGNSKHSKNLYIQVDVCDEKDD